MLPWPGRITEPGVIRQVDQHLGSRAGTGRHTRKQRFITDQDLDQTEMRQCDQLLARTGREIDRPGDRIDKGQGVAKRNEFTKGNKAALVIDRFDGAVGTHQDSRIEQPLLGIKTRHASDQPSIERQRFPGRCLQDLRLAIKEPGKGCFRPDHELRHGCLPARQVLQPFKVRGPEGAVPFFMLRYSWLHQTSHLERG